MNFFTINSSISAFENERYVRWKYGIILFLCSFAFSCRGLSWCHSQPRSPSSQTGTKQEWAPQSCAHKHKGRFSSQCKSYKLNNSPFGQLGTLRLRNMPAPTYSTGDSSLRRVNPSDSIREERDRYRLAYSSAAIRTASALNGGRMSAESGLWVFMSCPPCILSLPSSSQ